VRPFLFEAIPAFLSAILAFRKPQCPMAGIFSWIPITLYCSQIILSSKRNFFSDYVGWKDIKLVINALSAHANKNRKIQITKCSDFDCFSNDKAAELKGSQVWATGPNTQMDSASLLQSIDVKICGIFYSCIDIGRYPPVTQ